MDILESGRIADALERVTDYWTPRVVGRLKDQCVKAAKLLGELDPGQFFVVPKGVQHNPVADEEVGIVLIESVTTAHTGSVKSERTVSLERQLSGA